MIYRLYIIATLIALFTNIANANFLDVSTSPSNLTIYDTAETVTISGTVEQKTNIIIKIIGPLKNYKARRYQEVFGVWSLTKPQIIRNQPTFYQIFSSQNIFSSLNIDQLQSNLLDPGYFISEHSVNPDSGRITQLLIKNSLVSPEVLPIEFLGDHFYRAEVTMPTLSADGEYNVQVWGIDQSGTIISTANTSFQITHDQQSNPIITFKKMHPALYVASCILIALVIGFFIGSLRNAAKQQ
jgi:hypothetical protein